jgi:hypothetical protein
MQSNGFDVDQNAKALSVEDDGIVVEIMDPQGDPAYDVEGKPVTVTVAGEYSAKYRRAEEWQRKTLMRMRGKEQTGAESLEMQAEFIARCTLGWSGFTQAGQTLPFTTENATMVFVKLPFVRKRVESAMSDHAAFFAKGSTSSVST